MPSKTDRRKRAILREKCRRDFFTYVRWTFPGTYRVNFHHRRIADALQRVEQFKTRKLIITLPPRMGKALKVGTPIPTPSGFKPIEELGPGDTVFDENGDTCNVVARSEVWKDRPCYQAVTSDGASIVVDENHEWTYQTCRKSKNWATKATKELTGRSRRVVIPRHGAVDYGDEKDLPVDPWVLGHWLGDGSSTHATIHSGDEDFDAIRDMYEARGVETSNRADEGTFGALGIQGALKEMGLMPEKFVPDVYKTASREQRLDVVRGLVDSDGHVDENGFVEVSQKRGRLAKDLQELVRSLGSRCTISKDEAKLDGVRCGTRHRVKFRLDDCATLERKNERTFVDEVRDKRYIDFHEAGRADTVCIEVDSDSSLFLAGRGFIPTHNSELVSRRFPSWLHGRDPTRGVIAASHSKNLARRNSKDVQRIIETDKYSEIFPAFEWGDKQAADAYTTSAGGQYKATSTTARIAGFGATFGIIDDYFGTRAEAESQSNRDRLWEWYTDDFSTRLEYPSAQIVMATRWHHDDLIGRLLETEGDEWEVIEYPYIATSPTQDRDVGDPLWPEWFRESEDDPPSVLRERALEYFEEKKSRNPYGAEALFQCNPTPREGGLYKREFFDVYSKPRDKVYRDAREVVVSVDAAFKSTSRSDPVSISVFARYKDSHYLLDDKLKRMDFPETKAAIQRMVKKWPDARVLIEDKANGPALISALRDEVRNRVEGFSPKNESKHSRAQAAADYLHGTPFFVPADVDWVEDWMMDITGYPGRPHDDRVDSLSQYLLNHRRKSSPRSHLRRLTAGM